jgi:hypothetical protein
LVLAIGQDHEGVTWEDIMSGDKVVFEVWRTSICGVRLMREKTFSAIEGINDEPERENAFAFCEKRIEEGENVEVFKRYSSGALSFVRRLPWKSDKSVVSGKT